MNKQTETICRHRITYWYNGYNGELAESEYEHIQDMLSGGCWCGELHFFNGEDEYWGWWEIERDKPSVKALPWHRFEVHNKVRCNNCYTIFDPDITECSECQTDDFLMQPYAHVIPVKYKYLTGNIYELDEVGNTNYTFEGRLYTVSKTCEGEYDVNVFEFDAVQDNPIMKHIDGGCCTGSVVDAVLFMLPTDKEGV